MIYKVYYQESKQENPRRENTHSLYLEAENKSEAIKKVEENTDFNLEQIEALTGKALEFEQQEESYKLSEF
ncbi:DNA-directed RNA polymerase subunit epsilon [Pediococcus argentinicus]|uniref:DNA-directed RNA polymerase subunit epsilon n=1 Tax=Pediococcus argentinicus TaxID=480391 RepID=A0A0R2NII1_9LACO|nr:DNA-directed RNA polymerase subunit epsilon [Pediococcus argentinicus]KRO25589.1 hypothetical protein IV88_GL001669 [Pediococcus argentinicus]NKZ22115.1 DNA-dependent RNA polymerase auxiliary subunit epsilon family protein [Pediococcus argentinicus]GEP19591.1 UPF0356 protein [Pediococcus argentinicus]